MNLLTLTITDHAELEVTTSSLFLRLPLLGELFLAKGEGVTYSPAWSKRKPRPTTTA